MYREQEEQVYIYICVCVCVCVLFERKFKAWCKETTHDTSGMSYSIKTVRSAHTVVMCSVFIWEKSSDLCHLKHKLIGFYNRDEKCLQRGADWVFK
jgi:hypothetical protein